MKEHIQLYSEKDAHGREAQYYIVENNRSAEQNAVDYFNSVYTGITRSEQGSIIITGMDQVGKGRGGYGSTTGISFKTKQDSEMLPNTYTDEGTRIFSRNRRAVLDSIFGDEEVTPFEIKARTREAVVLSPTAELDEPSTLEPSATPEPPSPVTPPTPPSGPTPAPSPTPAPNPEPESEVEPEP